MSSAMIFRPANERMPVRHARISLAAPLKAPPLPLPVLGDFNSDTAGKPDSSQKAIVAAVGQRDLVIVPYPTNSKQIHIGQALEMLRFRSQLRLQRARRHPARRCIGE